MLTEQYEQAEELSVRHSVDELDVMDARLRRKGTWASLVGLVSTLLVFFGADVGRAVGFTNLDPRAIMLPAMIGVGVFLFLNGRYNRRRSIIALAKKLRLRAESGLRPAGPDDGA